MFRFITIYSVDNFIPYKQTPEFLRYLAHRDGFLNSLSEAHYYIIHHQKELIDKPDETIEPNLVRHFIYIPPHLFRINLFLAWLNIVRDWEKFPAREQVLVINNTFHQVGLHFLARVAGWRSLKIAGTFFHHARQGFKKHIVNAMEWLHAFLATRVMIISPSGWEYVPKRFHQKTKYFIPNFLYDTPLQTLPKMNSIEAKPNSAICLSRLEPEKGLADLIKAWNTTDPEWQLTIYGDGSQKKYLLDLIKNLGLSDRVTIHDPVTHAEVFSSLSPYHVFILTSPSEGLGMCYLEALYMKVPCIGLRVAGVKDTLAEGRGILLEPVSWMTHLNGALQKATALNNSLEWHQKIETYFTTIILPTINPGTGVWFEK